MSTIQATKERLAREYSYLTSGYTLCVELDATDLAVLFKANDISIGALCDDERQLLHAAIGKIKEAASSRFTPCDYDDLMQSLLEALDDGY